ncbi:MAG: cytochrome P450 [Pseudomonadales bacterium]
MAELRQLYDPLGFEQGVPLDLLDRLREERAVVWVAEDPLEHWPGGAGFWLVLRHAEVMQVLRNPRQFSSALGATQLLNPSSQQNLRYVQKMMLNMDPPEHTRLRRLLQNSFTSKAIARLEESIRGHARSILDKITAGARRGDRGQCDFAQDIAADMPLLSLTDILGMPKEDRYLMYDWANRVIGFQDPEYATSASFDASAGSDLAREAVRMRPTPDAQGRMPDPRSREGMPDLYRYAHLLAEEKRRSPGEDIMSILLAQVDEEDGSVSLQEFENMFWLFSVAGNETVRNGIPGGMIALLQHPEVMVELRSKPELIPAAVDEMLRWWTPVMIFRRTAAEDLELAGEKIRVGDKVVVSFLAANYDPAVFTQPRQFNIHRTENPHLTFGYGPHFCLGAQLARAQMKAIFAETLRRFRTIKAAGEPTFLRSNFQRGVKTLPIEWYA